MNLQNLPPYELGYPGAMRQRLNAAVLLGKKVCTSSLLDHYEKTGEAIPERGQIYALVDSEGAGIAALEITKVEKLRLREISDEIAIAEGEDFADVSAWRTAHEEFWASDPLSISDNIEIDDESIVVVEWFRPLAQGATTQ